MSVHSIIHKQTLIAREVSCRTIAKREVALKVVQYIPGAIHEWHLTP